MNITFKIICTILFTFLFQIIVIQPIVSAQTPSPTPKTQEIPEIISLADDDLKSDEDIFDNNTNKKEPTELEKKLEKLSDRIKSLETDKTSNYDEEQKRLLLNLDILTKTEQRAENLRKKLIELIEKESEVKNRLVEIDFNLRPEVIERSTAMYGSLRPEDIREQRKANLQSEKNNLESLLSQIQNGRINLEENVRKADLWVEKVRATFEKQIDKALGTTEPEISN